MKTVNTTSSFVVNVVRNEEVLLRDSVEATTEQEAIDLAYKLAKVRKNKNDQVTVEEETFSCENCKKADAEEGSVLCKACLAEVADPATKRVRTGKYNAKATGVLTENNGLDRKAWANSVVVTEKERMILTELVDMLELKNTDGTWNFSDVSATDVAEATEMTVNQVNGALSVLIAKGLARTETEKRKEGKKTNKYRLIFLTPKGAELV
jgi:hypothetical protein